MPVVGCPSFSFCAHVQSRLTLCDPWTVARQATLSMQFSWARILDRLPFPTAGDLPDPGIELGSLIA